MPNKIFSQLWGWGAHTASAPPGYTCAICYFIQQITDMTK